MGLSASQDDQICPVTIDVHGRRQPGDGDQIAASIANRVYIPASPGNLFRKLFFLLPPLLTEAFRIHLKGNAPFHDLHSLLGIR